MKTNKSFTKRIKVTKNGMHACYKNKPTSSTFRLGKRQKIRLRLRLNLSPL